MRHISSHISASERPKEKATERGELMRYFLEKLNATRIRDGLPALSMPRMGRILEGIPTRDIYYLKSVCEQASSFSKKFWWEVNPKKHAPQPSRSLLPKKSASKRAPRTRG